MKHFVQFAVMTVLAFAASTSASAQKHGYVNSAAIIANMPETEAANAELEATQARLRKQSEQMVQSFQQEVIALQKRVQEGSISAQEQEKEAARMKTSQDQIKEFDGELVQIIQDKRRELITPIYAKFNATLKQVAEENGYEFIFDQEDVLYADPSRDVTGLMRAKLGL